jgi:para-nitrobenzyl esterase
MLLLLLLATVARAEETVKLDTGEIAGSVVTKEGAPELHVYKGIPFAAPPVGELRWKAPQRPAPWQGVRSCTKFGNACPQPSIPLMSVDEPQSEDCLYLNVWTPAKKATEKLPVMVWIHGGSYAFGSGAQSIYDGEALARRGVVVVTINYRLNAFGFLAHPALSAESGKGSGNYGLLDQIAALEWVKRNIAAFGGDKDCVTIFGESAGGGSVMALLISPLAKGLFHRAVAQSGVLFARPLREAAYGQEPAEKVGERFAAKLGCDTLSAMRQKSAKEVLAAAMLNANPLGEGGHDLGPVADGWVIPGDPYDLMRQQRDVPLLLGTTADEGTLFVVGSAPSVSADAYKKFVTATFGAQAEKVLGLFPARTDKDVSKALAAFLRDVYFIGPNRAFARSRAGLASKTFLYHFTRATPLARTMGLGAHHAAELRYVFDTLDGPGSFGYEAKDHALATKIADAWVRFAKTGDPNGEGLPEWPAYTKEKDEHLELGEEIRVGSGLEREACDTLDRVWAAMHGASRRRWL